jgi:hypothetical protein
MQPSRSDLLGWVHLHIPTCVRKGEVWHSILPNPFSDNISFTHWENKNAGHLESDLREIGSGYLVLRKLCVKYWMLDGKPSIAQCVSHYVSQQEVGVTFPDIRLVNCTVSTRISFMGSVLLSSKYEMNLTFVSYDVNYKNGYGVYYGTYTYDQTGLNGVSDMQSRAGGSSIPSWASCQ